MSVRSISHRCRDSKIHAEVILSLLNRTLFKHLLYFLSLLAASAYPILSGMVERLWLEGTYGSCNKNNPDLSDGVEKQHTYASVYGLDSARVLIQLMKNLKWWVIQIWISMENH